MATEKRSEHAISAMSDTDPLLLEQAAACWEDVQLVKELCPIFKLCRDTSKAHAIRPVLCSKIEQTLIYLKDSTITWLHQHGQQEQAVQHALSQMPRVLSIWERLTNDEVWRISPVSAHIKEAQQKKAPYPKLEALRRLQVQNTIDISLETLIDPEDEKDMLTLITALGLLVEAAKSAPGSQNVDKSVAEPQTAEDLVVAAESYCRRSTRLFDLLTRNSGDCSKDHSAVVELSRLGGTERDMHFLLSPCEENFRKQRWYLVTCSEHESHQAAECFSICNHFGDQTNRYMFETRLEFYETRLWYEKEQEIEDDEKLVSGLSALDTLVENRPPAAAVRRILQCMLVWHLIHLIESPWCLGFWEISDVYFALDDDDPKNLADYLLFPYAQTPLWTSNQIGSRDHSEASFLSFALLLLQIECTHSLDQLQIPEQFKRDDISLHKRISKFCTNLEKEGYINKLFAEIIRSMLRFRHHASSGTQYRTFLLEKVFEPLKDDLLVNHSAFVTSKSERLPQHIVPRERQKQRAQESSLASHRRHSAQNLTRRAMPLAVGDRSSISEGICLHDDGSRQAFNMEQGNKAQAFIDQLGCFHDRLFTERPDLPPVKVAILDTGFHVCEKTWMLYRPRVKEVRSWLGQTPIDITQSGGNDPDGHGTHCATAFLKCASGTCELFVAQVFKSRPSNSMARATVQSTNFDDSDANRVAEAIIYAVEVWGVDVISMSFGYRDEVTIIENALKKADANNVLLIAAASNVGGNTALAQRWPSTRDNVMSIYAAEGKGSPYADNPPHRTNAYNFATLGVMVPVWSAPDKTGASQQTWCTGTSYATPIASAIAASVLELIRYKTTDYINKSSKHQYSRDKINIALSAASRASGMCKIFKLMAEKKGDYDYVQPANLLETDLVSSLSVLEKFVEVLRKP